MDAKLRKKLETVIIPLGLDEIHGIPHIRRMLKTFELFKGDNPPVNEDVMDAIETAIYLHDIGRSIPGGGHATNSVSMMKELFEGKSLFADVPHMDWILYAVSKHSTGPEPERDKVVAKDDYPGQVMALLILMDHMDTLGAIGIYRNIRFMQSVKLEPSEGSQADMVKRVNRYLHLSHEVASNEGENKKISVLDLLSFHCAITYRIRSRALPFIGSRLILEIFKREKLTRLFIEDLLMERKEI